MKKFLDQDLSGAALVQLKCEVSYDFQLLCYCLENLSWFYLYCS